MGVFLGPLGGLREVGEVQAGVQVSSSRPSSERVTLDGRRIIQRAPRASRSWALSLGSWRDPSVAAYMSSCASGVFAGPLYLLTAHAAATNMLPANVAAPGAMGSHGLLTSAGLFPNVGTVPVHVAGQGVVPSVGVVQSAAAGAWSKTVPVRQVPLVLSAWASAAGSSIEWRTVNAAGGVAQSGGVVSAAAVVGGFRGEVAITPSATAVGVQVRVAAGSRVVGGLRLAEGVPRGSGPVVATNVATNPSFEVNATGWSAVAGAGGTASIGAASIAPRVGSRHGRVSWSTPSPGGSYPGALSGSWPATGSAGQWVAASMWIRTSLSVNSRVAIRLRAGGAQILASDGPSFSTSWSGWTRVTHAVQATAAFDQVALYPHSPLAASLTYFDMDGVITAVANSESAARAIVDAYFDGANNLDPSRYLAAWTGTPNASTSTLREIPANAASEDWRPGQGVPMVVVRDPSQTMQLSTPGNHRSDYAVTIEEVG